MILKKSATAFGLINVFGDHFLLNETLFKNNTNKISSGFYISSNKINGTLKVYKTIFLFNEALERGPSFVIGQNAFSLFAYFENLVCMHNKGLGLKRE